MNSETDIHDILRDLRNGEPTAPRRIVTRMLPPLLALLRRQFFVLPRETLEDAAHDALLALIQAPERYDPARFRLLAYLGQIARNKVVDNIRVWARHRNIQFVGGSVELAQVEANSYRVDQIQSDLIAPENDDLPLEVEALLRQTLPDTQDRRLWELICEGRKDTAEYAALLGISHLALDEQQAEVKRQRERVAKRVRRRRKEFQRLLFPDEKL
jgi:RNA polymerase sigma factor (sigma-70 family)